MKKLLLLTALCLSSFWSFGQSWNEIIKLVASDRNTSDQFGYRVSIDGDKAVVGAYTESEDADNKNSLNAAGSAYVFEFQSGTWVQTAKIVANDRAQNDWFGISVAINNQRIVVGAYSDSEDENGNNTLKNSGSAYVFELKSDVWKQTAKLVASDRESEDRFGVSVAIDLERIIIGAYFEDENQLSSSSLNDSGSAYIFELKSNKWIQTSKIVASDRGEHDSFGVSVAINNNVAIVGAFYESEDLFNNNTLNSSGSAYIFEFQTNQWVQTSKLVASDRGEYDNFGVSVAIDNNVAIVGAYHEDENHLSENSLSNSGSAYVFELKSNKWVQTSKLVASDRNEYDNFGISVDIDNNVAIVGAQHEDDDLLGGNTLNNSGSAYIFEFQTNQWIQTEKLSASDREMSDLFGGYVSISENKAIIGAYSEDEDVSNEDSLNAAGSAYVFDMCLRNNPLPEVSLLDTVEIICALTTLNSPTAKDNCGNLIFATHNVIFPLSKLGETIVIWTYEDAAGNTTSQTQNVIITCAVGIEKNNLSNVIIFPNPTRKEVTLSLTETMKVELKDINGKVLFTDKNASGEYTIDLSSYSKGFYFVNVSNQNGSAAYKVIKE